MYNLNPTNPHRGPRAADDIFRETLQLLAERGYAGLTIEGVAERAGVNKTTIYRWWSSKAALLYAAVIHAKIFDLDVPDLGSLRADLTALVGNAINLLTSKETGSMVRAALLAAAGEEELAGLPREFFADRLRREEPVFARAVARGELGPEADTWLLADLLIGALWFRVLFRNAPVEPDFAGQIVDAILDGLAATHGDPGRKPAHVRE